MLRYQGRLCVPNNVATKMYRDLREIYWWNRMKKDIVEFVAKCPNCQQVKVEHQKPGYSRSNDKIDSFNPCQGSLAEDYAKLHLSEMVKLQGVPLSIISDRGTQFTSQFWKSFQKDLGTRVDLKRLKTAQSRQKSYADIRRRDLEFDMNDWVYLKKSPIKGVMRFGKKGKLCPRYVVPYQILRHTGKVAYELELASVHLVFHVSMLNKCVGDLTSIVPLEDLGVKENLTYKEAPVEILDRQVKKLRNKEVAFVKVLWRNQLVEGATWEVEVDMMSRYPHFFPSTPILA
ncbi:hypothetical protein MTR67_018555 [Solanum verrucosum]|uniref:Polyprotein n=1 Tax=Solanum verrucosum TaxID=315347 RepID=A0AAF0QQ03_SOLVR|nr:hypothetical protein MTR67_018555 [Solanum verrucosum]